MGGAQFLWRFTLVGDGRYKVEEATLPLGEGVPAAPNYRVKAEGPYSAAMGATKIARRPLQGGGSGMRWISDQIRNLTPENPQVRLHYLHHSPI